MSPVPEDLLTADWREALRIYRERFAEALERGDEDEAVEACSSALVAERMVSLQAAV